MISKVLNYWIANLLLGIIVFTGSHLLVGLITHNPFSLISVIVSSLVYATGMTFWRGYLKYRRPANRTKFKFQEPFPSFDMDGNYIESKPTDKTN